MGCWLGPKFMEFIIYSFYMVTSSEIFVCFVLLQLLSSNGTIFCFLSTVFVLKKKRKVLYFIKDWINTWWTDDAAVREYRVMTIRWKDIGNLLRPYITVYFYLFTHCIFLNNSIIRIFMKRKKNLTLVLSVYYQ